MKPSTPREETSSIPHVKSLRVESLVLPTVPNSQASVCKSPQQKSHRGSLSRRQHDTTQQNTSSKSPKTYLKQELWEFLCTWGIIHEHTSNSFPEEDVLVLPTDVEERLTNGTDIVKLLANISKKRVGSLPNLNIKVKGGGRGGLFSFLF